MRFIRLLTIALLVVAGMLFLAGGSEALRVARDLRSMPPEERVGQELLERLEWTTKVLTGAAICAVVDVMLAIGLAGAILARRMGVSPAGKRTGGRRSAA